MSVEIKQYVDNKKELQEKILKFVLDEEDANDEFNNLIEYIEKQIKVEENPEELKLLLNLISRISNNHYRHKTFISKIFKILSSLEQNIKKLIPNHRVFNIFKTNKLVLLFLFQKKIIIPDENIINYIISQTKFNYDVYFYEEIKPYINKTKEKIIENKLTQLYQNSTEYFEENRQKGENDSYICYLIRNDLVEEFVIYVNKNNLLLSKKISSSIFETNSFLLKNQDKTTLIEYAAFYGSIQIFQYLILNNVVLEPSLWLYAIHGNNPELIHILERNNVELPRKSYNDCFKESVKCHHNEMAYYFKNIIDSIKMKYSIRFGFIKNSMKYSFRYCNYEFFPAILVQKHLVYFYCKYGYLKIVDLYFKNYGFNVNEPLISNDFFLIK